jgi:hypothetical protein
VVSILYPASGEGVNRNRPSFENWVWDCASGRLIMNHSFENTGARASVSSSRTLDCVIPAWSAGIQLDMDVSEGILASLDAGNPCRYDEDLDFHVL